MSTHRSAVAVSVFGVALGLSSSPARAQPPPAVDDSAVETIPRAEDASERALRSLYVPDGLTSDRAVSEVIATSPDLRRTKALLKEAKGGALQAMSGLVPQLALLARASKLSEVETAGIATGADPAALDTLINGLDDPNAQILWRGLTSFQFPSLTKQYATDATLSYSFTRSLAEAMPAYRAAKKSKEAAKHQIQAELNDVAFAGRQAYYEYARAEASLAVANFALEAAVSQRKETESFFNAGSAAHVDLMRVRAQEEAARVAVEQAKLGVEVAARALQTLMHTGKIKEPCSWTLNNAYL